MPDYKAKEGSKGNLVAAWQNQNDDGSAWFGLSAETLPSDDAPVAAAPPPPPPPPVADNDFEDDIPF